MPSFVYTATWTCN